VAARHRSSHSAAGTVSDSLSQRSGSEPVLGATPNVSASTPDYSGCQEHQLECEPPEGAHSVAARQKKRDYMVCTSNPRGLAAAATAVAQAELLPPSQMARSSKLLNSL
jgi:hypothetical protein